MKTNEIVFSRNGNIYLDSSMTQRAFAKTRLSEKIKEEGIIARINKGNVEFNSWCFSGTQSSLDFLQRPGETVLFEGEAFDGYTLKDYLDSEEEPENDEEKAFCTEAAALVIKVLDEAVFQEIEMHQIGAAGIFISTDLTQVLFLPHSLYDTAIACFGDKIYSHNNGFFIQPNLADTAAVNFTQSVIAYKLLTGEYPYSADDSGVRHEDCLDRNYIRIKDAVWGLNSELAFFIDSSLQKAQKIEKRKGGKVKAGTISEKISSDINEGRNNSIKSKTDFILHFPMELFYAETGLSDKGRVNAAGLLNDVNRDCDVSREQFEINAEKTYIRFAKALKTKRWFRHNRVTITVCCVVVVLAGFFTYIYRTDKQRGTTTTGLTSVETLEMYYSAYNRMDVDSVQNSASGKEASRQVEILSNFYVAAKQRATYSPKDTTVTPAEWLSYNRDLNFNIFGLSQFYVDGEKKSLYFDGPVKNTHPRPLTQEKGVTLANRATVSHEVKYYHLFNEGPDTMEVMEHNDIVTLVFNDKRWTVSNIQLGTQLYEIDMQEFKKNYAAAMEASGNDVHSAAALLREQYPWINDESEIIQGYECLKKKYDWIE